MSPSAFVRWLGYGTGALGVVLVAWTIVPRFASPWPIEWMEGASLQHALRLVQGLPLYAAPSAEFVPYLYPPLSYLPMAVFAWLLGPSLWVGRLVSIAAFAGSLACTGRIAARSTGAGAAGWAAVGLYALGFGYTGAFHDLVRVDSVFALLVLLGLERLSAGSPRAGFAWLVLSCFAKQHGVLFLAAAWLARREERRAIALSAAALAAGVFGLEAFSDGYFLRYTWFVPQGHGLEPVLLFSYFGVDVLLYLPVLALMVGLRLARKDSALDLGWMLWLAAGLAASALGRAHPGGDDNVRLPGFAVLVIAGAIAWWELSARRLWSAALALQALWLLQLPAAHVPDSAHARGFEPLVAALDRCSGGQLRRAVALDHALLTGRPFVHTMALSDLHTARDRDLAEGASRALIDALASRDAPPSLAVSVTFPQLRAAIGQHYALCAELPPMRMPTGYAVGATRVYRRRDVQLAEAGLPWR